MYNRTTYLVPMLLDTSLSSAGECLPKRSQSIFFMGACQLLQTFRSHTFAISAQLLPASLMVFSLCSSAAVQGVFVRLFFAGGCTGDDCVSCSAILDDGTAVVAIGAAEATEVTGAADGAGTVGLVVGPETRRLLRGLGIRCDSC